VLGEEIQKMAEKKKWMGAAAAAEEAAEKRRYLVAVRAAVEEKQQQQQQKRQQRAAAAEKFQLREIPPEMEDAGEEGTPEEKQQKMAPKTMKAMKKTATMASSGSLREEPARDPFVDVLLDEGAVLAKDLFGSDSSSESSESSLSPQPKAKAKAQGKGKGKGKKDMVKGRMHIIIKPGIRIEEGPDLYPKFFLSVKPSDTIILLKAMIEGLIGASPTSQTLTFKGKKLVNGRTLSDYNVQHFMTLGLKWNDQGQNDVEMFEWSSDDA
jgi:hypothetical protein